MLLEKGEYGVLSTVDQAGQPYGIPLNYAFENGCIYFHSACSGHKLDNIERNSLVSFCVVGRTHVLAAEFATEYESVVVFGKALEAKGKERMDALIALLEKYSPSYLEEGKRYIQLKDKATAVIKIDITHVSGKARR